MMDKMKETRADNKDMKKQKQREEVKTQSAANIKVIDEAELAAFIKEEEEPVADSNADIIDLEVTDEARSIITKTNKGTDGAIYTQQGMTELMVNHELPQVRPFEEQIPLAMIIDKGRIVNKKKHLIILEYDEYREVNEDGTEAFPQDVYTKDQSGRAEHLQQLMEYKMRCTIRMGVIDGRNRVKVQNKLATGLADALAGKLK